METTNKSKTSFIVMIVALILAFCIAAVSLLSSVYLYISGSQDKKEITALKNDISALKQKNDSLNSSFTTLTQGDIATMKGDIEALKGGAEELKGSIEALKSDKDQPVFTLASFSLKFEPDTYTEDYAGTGIITCDKKDSYLLLVKMTLKSGGARSGEPVNYMFVTVTNGTGKFTTFDWDEAGKLQKPNYAFEMLGFIRTEPVK